MGLMSEFFASHMVPRLTIGKPEDAPDGYAVGRTIGVGTDGYVMDLRINTVYKLTTLSQALWYGMLSDDEILANRLANLDYTTDPLGVGGIEDGYLLGLLDATSGVPNGHYLAASGTEKIATTAKCKKLLLKSAASTATVTVAPLGSFVDPPDNGDRNK